MSRPPRILVLRGGAIGDFIATLPVLQALRRQWPESYIELIGYPHIARLALAGGLADRVQGLDTARMARFFGRTPAIDDDSRRFLASFDFVVSFLHDPDGVVNENLCRHGVRRLLYQSPCDPNGHIVDHLLRPLESVAIYDAGARPALDLPEDLRDRARAAFRELGCATPPWVFHAGSGSPRKNWPWEGFRAVADTIRPRTQLAWLLGEADAALAPTVRSYAAATGAAVIEGRDLVEVAGLLSVCRGFLGNDSGIAHIAAAVGAPVVALFGPTDPAVWAPRGRRVRVLRAADHRLETITPEEVARAIEAMEADQ